MKKISSLFIAISFFFVTDINAKGCPYFYILDPFSLTYNDCGGIFNATYCSAVRVLCFACSNQTPDSTIWFRNDQQLETIYGADTFFAKLTGCYTPIIYKNGVGSAPEYLPNLYVQVQAPCPAPSTGFFTSGI